MDEYPVLEYYFDMFISYLLIETFISCEEEAGQLNSSALVSSDCRQHSPQLSLPA